MKFTIGSIFSQKQGMQIFFAYTFPSLLYISKTGKMTSVVHSYDTNSRRNLIRFIKKHYPNATFGKEVL
jgi:hypothetical protein